MRKVTTKRPRKIVRVSKRRLLDDFFKIDEHVVRHERFDGEMSPDQRLLVFERGDAAGALLYDPAERKVILITQFRLATVGKVGSEGWLTETAAGMIDAGETPEECITREIEEETGYRVSALHPVARYFSSPGGTSELIHLFYAEVTAGDRRSAGGGVAGAGEDIRLESYPVAAFFKKLDNLEFHDPKIIIAGQWLKAKLG